MVHDWERTSLNGDWVLYCQQNSEYMASGGHPVTYDAICGMPDYMPARVPGNLELDLQRAGHIGDPFFGLTTLKLQKLESLHMFYGRRFEYHRPVQGQTAEAGIRTGQAAQTGLGMDTRRYQTTPVLTFEGLDTVAEIFLNGCLVGRCENMLITQTFVLSDLKDGENDLVVHIIPACIAARGRKMSAANNALKYDYESLRLRKSASMFGWDIMPRLVSGGIWRPVYIEEVPRESLRQVYLMTTDLNVEEETASLVLFYEADVWGDDLSEYRIRLTGTCGDSTFAASDRLWYTAGKLYVSLEHAKFWWPKGQGSQDLYEVEVELTRNGDVVDTWHTRTGIRTVSLERTALTDPFFGGKFRFLVNGRSVFILGTNFVPVDAMHSRDRERLPRVLELLEDSGCNAIRCWGGSVYEDDLLYDFCDEKGILIWQDFMMACGTYPIDDAFCKVMEEEAQFVVRRLRQHPSLLLWSGDNECDMSAFKKRPSGNRITREVLPAVVEYEDPVRPFLPSSPFVDREAEGVPEAYLPENHLWGPRDYYKSDYYRNSLCSFASEIGYHGCPARESIEAFLPPEHSWPWQDNDYWMAHASSMELGNSGNFNYRIRLMADQIRELFGVIPDNLEDFVTASQISQAEAKKFFIELFRTGQPDRTGIIWWNLIDGWPQFSDAVVDYYFRKKLAYYYIRQVQQPVLLSMKEPKDWHLEMVAVNDTGGSIRLVYSVEELTAGLEIDSGEIFVPEGMKHIMNIPYSQGEKKIYRMHWEYGAGRGWNHYLAGNPPFSLQEYKTYLLDSYREIFPDMQKGNVSSDWHIKDKEDML